MQERVHYFVRQIVLTKVSTMVRTITPLAAVIFLLFSIVPAQAIIIAPTLDVFGVVTDSSTGEPLAGVSVSITGPFDHYDVVTDDAGLYQSDFIFCDGNPTSVNVSINEEGYESYSQALAVPCYFSYEHNIALPPAAQEPEPVILIPGIMASWNARALAGMVLGEWELDPIFHTYNQLIANLIEYGGYVEGESLFTLPYDWRNNNVITAAYLKDKIDEVKAQTGASQVDIVAHSMGGLVARFYAESELYEQDIDQIIFIASPQLGAPKSYLTWEAGYVGVEKKDIIREWLMQQIAEVNGYDSVFEYVREEPLGSVQDLLPVYSYLFDQPDNILRVYPDGYPRNQRLEFFNEPDSLAKLYSSGIEITEIYSDMPDTTITSYNVVDATDEQLPLWEHGYVNGFTDWNRSGGVNLGRGDLTVPTVSSSFLDSDREIVYYDVNHTDIVSRASQDVVDVLTGQYVEINVVDQPDNYIIIQVHSPVDFQVISPSGERIGKDFLSNQAINDIAGAFYSGFDTPLEFVTIPEPENGEYQIVLKGTDAGGYSLTTGYAGDEITLTSAQSGSIMPNQEIIYDLELNISGPEPKVDLQPQDQVPPQLTVESPQPKEYVHSDIVPINYTVSDNGTGVADEKIYLNNTLYSLAAIDLFEYSLGEHSFTVWAQDWVGNQAETGVTFAVIADFDSLRADINRLFAEGDIKDKKTTQRLLKRVDKLEKWYNKINKSEAKDKHKKDNHHRDEDDEDWDEPGYDIKDKWLSKLADKYLNKLEKKGLISPKAKEMILEQITYIINHL